MRKKLLILALALTAAALGTMAPQAVAADPCLDCDPVTMCCWDYCRGIQICY